MEKEKEGRSPAQTQREKGSKKKLEAIEIIHEVDESQLNCPNCKKGDYSDLGKGQENIEYEYLPAQTIKQRHIRKKKLCSCKLDLVTAPNIERVVPGTIYGPGFYASVIVQKCSDSLPFHRQAKIQIRAGVPVAKSTLCDLFHRGARVLSPIYERMRKEVACSEHVNADETPVKILKKGGCKKGWMWVFIAEGNLLFVFSASRSGEVPNQVLGGTKGKLQVDGYTGYNQVSDVEGRERAGCMAHSRRYFVKALETARTDAEYTIAQILELYRVEYKAAEKGCLETDEHLLMRQVLSKSIMLEWKEWLKKKQKLHPPKSPMGKAIGYALNNWDSLTKFLDDPKLRLDNNVSERALRSIAVGRKNFLFVGNEQAGQNLAILQSLVGTCESNGINPQSYLTDVLIRIKHHPPEAIDDLLPMNWAKQNFLKATSISDQK